MDFDALERLGRLRATGAISDEEFESEKQRILGAYAAQNLRSVPIQDVPMSAVEEWTSDESHTSKARLPLLILFALVALATVGFFTYRYVLPQKPSQLSSATDGPVKYALRSKVSGIRIAPTTELPQNPHGNDPSCNPYEKSPAGTGAKLVRAKGWHVIAENPVGKFDAISFVGACTPVSGNVFTPIDPNVGMFEGDELRAVIYGKRLGFAESTDDPTELRITNKTNDEAIGTLVVTTGRITVQK